MLTSTPTRTGVIVAGGRSTRFGEADKAVAELAGTPMIRRVGDRLLDAVDALVINCRPEQVDAIRAAFEGYPLEVAFAEDEETDLGPVAGIRNGLRAAPSRYAFVVACDMPFVDPAFADYLFERAEGHEAAVPQLDDEWFQTTQAVYAAGPMADACDRALERGERRVVEPLFELDYVVVGDREIRERVSPRTFENLNTREEFEEAQAEFA